MITGIEVGVVIGCALIFGAGVGMGLMKPAINAAMQDGWDRGRESMRREILRYIAEVARSPKQYGLLTDNETLFSPTCNVVLLGDGIVVSGLDAQKHEALVPDFAHRCCVTSTYDFYVGDNSLRSNLRCRGGGHT